MAIINQIGGISTASIASVVKGPLEKLFGSGTKQYQYKYPLDLAQDPARMHAVQFIIYNIDPAKWDTKKKDALNSATEAGKSVINSGGVAAGASTAAGLATGLSQSTEAFLKPPVSQTTTTINLYMPDTLAMNYNAGYTEISIMDATSGWNRKIGNVGSLAENAIKGYQEGKGVGGTLTSMLDKISNDPHAMEAAGRMIGNDNLTKLGLSAMGKAINPQLQLIFDNIGFRDFTMEFLFTPKSKEESDQVSAIVNAFTYASRPTITDKSMYFIPPSQFEIKFLAAKSADVSGLVNALQKTGNSLISGLPLGNAAADLLGMNATSGAENERLFKFGRCVLESVAVDYAPNGQWVAYAGGAPVQTRLMLSFKEIELLDRTRMKDGKAR